MLLISTFHLVIPSSASYDYYALFYVLAFALNLVLLVWEGHRRGYPMRTWLVLLVCTTLAFILGTKLLAFSPAEWQQLLHTGNWPTSGARTVLGGALAGTLTLLALRRPFGFSWHVFDAFTLPMCAALVVQCVGCVLTGCCFGELTSGSWGLTYAPHTLPYVWQLSRGLIPADAAQSLPVHPTQLYSLVLCAAVGTVLVLTRHRAWPGGSRRLLHLGLLLAGRFLVEFWRDPAGEQVGAALHTHGGLALKQVQWALLLLAPLALGGWLWLLRRARRVPMQPEVIPNQNPVRNLLAVAALLALTAWLGAHALTLPEVLVVKALLLTVLTLEGGALLLGAATALPPARVALPLALAGVVLVLTSQQLPADSATATEAAYFSFTPGIATGRYDEDVTYTPSGGCSGGGGTPTRTGYYHSYQTVGGDFSYTRPSSRRPGRTTYGIGVRAGNEYVNAQSLTPGGPFLTADPKDGRHFPLLDVNPYVERDRLRANGFGYGVRLGLHVGELGHLSAKNAGPELRKVSAQPDAKIWLGVRRTLFAQADFGNGPLALGNPTGRLALGSGLGSDWTRCVLGGVALADHESEPTMGFLSASFPLGRSGLWLEPYGATNFGRHRQGSVRLQYRLKTR
ncbi:Prolipoprotein diacylglyceryltransferase [Hymenobacter daecheongensis DSM 21074]|uniref:Prolipoprotein diacylglyceryltransferase n=1 Tax=Hymenobacter daecheongensis DSM 21074 TaxID=1121955 RepID=A0A1M6KHZ6_9BACT|nr:prolipoprotein diacylglyceryl transferase family protein [Hymenobacter daecheongensis]SHJ58534.1 Prolipoprotein diacylglyceryltransferase [Hymenobacter daecheongensis DSM 21074]